MTSLPPVKLPHHPDALPAHQGSTLSDSERLALPDLVWTPHHPGRNFLGVREEDELSGEGSFTLMPERKDENNITEFRYRLPVPAGKTIEDFFKPMPEGLAAGDLEWHLRHNSSPFTSHEVGYFSSQSMAVQLLDQMRRQPAGLDIEQAISEAGFVHQHDLESAGKRTRVYRRDLDHQGSFGLMVSNINVHLTYEKNRASNGWTNLMNLYTVTEHHNGAFCPIAWPLSIAQPIEAAVVAAITLADTWRPEASKKPKIK